MAAICRHFVQNAWKKDLCSNCFKSREEHNNEAKSRHLGIMYKARQTAESAPQGILKAGQPRRAKGSAVHFPAEESQVIGFGGDECYSSDGEETNLEPEENGVTSDEGDGGEEDRALQKLTRTNTDFNTVTANLSGEGETKRTYTQLMLGKPLVDSDGRRKTLMVSVTPFGGQEESDNRKNKINKNTELPSDKSSDIVLKSIVTKKVNGIPHQNSRDIILKSMVKQSDEDVLQQTKSKETESCTNKTREISLKLVTIKTEDPPASRIPVIKSRVSPEKLKTTGRTSTFKVEDTQPKPAARRNSQDGGNKNNKKDALKSAADKKVIINMTAAEQPCAEENVKNEAKVLESAEIKVLDDNIMESVVVEAHNTEVTVVEQKPEPVVETSPAQEEPCKELPQEVQPEQDRKIEGEPSAPDVSPCKEEDVVDSVKMFCVEESREQAGEPDGRADPDELTEPPALPRSPPPLMDPRPSFLHNLRKPLGDKPKIAAKPVIQTTPRRPSASPKLPKKEEHQEVIVSQSEDVVCEASESDQSQESARAQKRQAPKPPPEVPCPIFTRNPSVGLTKSSPVAREKEKRERASSCSPKLRTEVVSTTPEPAPRRSLSLSVESVATPVEPEKKKSRFSLRKLLRLGGGSKEDKFEVSRPQEDTTVLPRPRLEIIHPSELNGCNVEVVRRSLEDGGSTSSSSSDTKDADVSSDSSGGQSNSQVQPARPVKPPPPPRNQSLDAWGKSIEGMTKPARPPPPKSAELLRQQKQAPTEAQPPIPVNNLYANLGLISGEARSVLTPNKPQRTSSMRDANTDGPKRRAASQTEDSGYESVDLNNGKHTLDVTENVYECVTPLCEREISDVTTRSVRYNGLQQRRSEGSMDTSPDYLKFRGSFTRSTSLPYCGSETESDIYSPYSFYGSEDAGDDDSEWSPSSGHPWKTSKLRLRKGRSVVHKSLEDNYGAVIVANHEALAQVVEQVNVGAVVPFALRVLKSAANLRWSDFTLLDDSRSVVVGKRSFHAALWGLHGVTLSLTADQSTLPSRGHFSLCPLTEFSDLVPAYYLPGQPRDCTELTQACVAVLARLQVDTIQSYGTSLRARLPEEDQWRDGSFVLLQLINGLKTLQAQGIEEAPLSLSTFALCREERDSLPRLCILQSLASGGDGSLCQCALVALGELMSSAPLTSLVRDLLRKERAVSLSQVKSVLEFSLWGPADVALGASPPDRELVLQRWLDLERATVLHGLVRTRVELTAFEECHLLFLVRTSAKMMCEASVLLDSNTPPETTSF